MYQYQWPGPRNEITAPQMAVPSSGGITPFPMMAAQYRGPGPGITAPQMALPSSGGIAPFPMMTAQYRGPGPGTTAPQMALPSSGGIAPHPMMATPYGWPGNMTPLMPIPSSGGIAPPPMLTAAPPSSEIPPGTPQGLEYLLLTDRVYIQQQVEWGEIVTGINTNNSYHIMDAFGRRMYFAAENSEFFELVCLGKCRPWTINLFDSNGQFVLQGHRESGCLGNCSNVVEVTNAAGEPMGGVIQNFELADASWIVIDSRGAPVLRLEAPAGSVICPSITTSIQAEFPLYTLTDHQKVGRIRKHFGGVLQEMYTAADNFGVEFPVDLDVKLKATLIFITFMIDFMFYEDVPTRHRHHHNHYPF